jgi:hypothetical protein
LSHSVPSFSFLFFHLQGGNPGALGRFRQFDSEDDNDNNEGMIPIHSPTSRTLAQLGSASHSASFQNTTQETYSDVPSDELRDMINNSQEQDLSGFDKARDIQKGLGQFSSSPERNIFRSSFRTRDNQPTSPLSVPSVSSGSFDTDKERKRIKRAARKQRAERKQPPVTMEV